MHNLRKIPTFCARISQTAGEACVTVFWLVNFAGTVLSADTVTKKAKAETIARKIDGVLYTRCVTS